MITKDNIREKLINAGFQIDDLESIYSTDKVFIQILEDTTENKFKYKVESYKAPTVESIFVYDFTKFLDFLAYCGIVLEDESKCDHIWDKPVISSFKECCKCGAYKRKGKYAN